MNIKTLFLDVCKEQEMGADEFLRHLGDSIRYLQTRFPATYLVSKEEYSLPCPQSLSEPSTLHDGYQSAMYHGVLYAKTGEERHRVRFVEDAERAYLSIWRQKAKGRRALPGGDGQ